MELFAKILIASVIIIVSMVLAILILTNFDGLMEEEIMDSTYIHENNSQNTLRKINKKPVENEVVESSSEDGVEILTTTSDPKFYKNVMKNTSMPENKNEILIDLTNGDDSDSNSERVSKKNTEKYQEKGSSKNAICSHVKKIEDNVIIIEDDITDCKDVTKNSNDIINGKTLLNNNEYGNSVRPIIAERMVKFKTSIDKKEINERKKKINKFYDRLNKNKKFTLFYSNRVSDIEDKGLYKNEPIRNEIYLKIHRSLFDIVTCLTNDNEILKKYFDLFIFFMPPEEFYLTKLIQDYLFNTYALDFKTDEIYFKYLEAIRIAGKWPSNSDNSKDDPEDVLKLLTDEIEKLNKIYKDKL